MEKGIWLLGILGLITVILLSILVFVPANTAQNNPQPIVEGLQVTFPKVNEEISSPIKITGIVNGDGWTGFEGQVGTVKLLDSNGKELASGFLAATTEWTALPTSFETILDFKISTPQSGVLIFHNENASGLPEKDKTYILTVKLK